jgi:hypothetical protein
MATSAQLKSSIKQIESAMKNKNLSSTSKAKFKTQLDRLKGELSSLNSPSPKKGVTKTKVMTSLQKLKATIKADKNLKGYKNSGIDIEKDADVPAMKRGRRVSKGLKANKYGTAAENKGRVYYEYRLNRADVKQPPKKYPKLEDGGYMAKGIYTKADKDLYEYKEQLNKKYGVGFKNSELSEEDFEKLYDLKEKKNDGLAKKYPIENANKMADGGYMAKGGITEHGLRMYDTIISGGGIGKTTVRVHNEQYNEDARVDLNTGKRTLLEYNSKSKKWEEKMSDGGEMAKGGKLYVKSYADDKREKALHRGKRISDNGIVYYENRLDHADVDRRVRLEDGGDMGSIKSSMHRYDK